MPGGKRAEGILIECLEQLPSGLKARLRSLKEDEESFYAAVCAALGSIGTSASISALEAACSSRDSVVRESGVAALELVRSRG